jgi:toxin ParE1/3/4
MNPTPVELHPLAIAEARAARRWYARRSPEAAERFVAELDRAIDAIGSNPAICPSYLHGTRVRRLRRFPYLVIFRQTTTALQVLAVAHGKRRPGYWKKRIS